MDWKVCSRMTLGSELPSGLLWSSNCSWHIIQTTASAARLEAVNLKGTKLLHVQEIVALCSQRVSGNTDNSDHRNSLQGTEHTGHVALDLYPSKPQSVLVAADAHHALAFPDLFQCAITAIHWHHQQPQTVYHGLLGVPT